MLLNIYLDNFIGYWNENCNLYIYILCLVRKIQKIILFSINCSLLHCNVVKSHYKYEKHKTVPLNLWNLADQMLPITTNNFLLFYQQKTSNLIPLIGIQPSAHFTGRYIIFLLRRIYLLMNNWRRLYHLIRNNRFL